MPLERAVNSDPRAEIEASRLSATKILWGQILVVSLIVLATIWAATQWTAWRLGFQPQLGHAMVRARRAAGLSAAGLLLVVVLVYDAYAPRHLRRRRLYRRVRRLRCDRRRHRHVGLARARGQERRDLRLGALGRTHGEVTARRPARPGRRGARPARARLSAPRRSRACAVLRADRSRQGRRPGRADAADLAGLGHRPRHQGRELAADRRLPGALRPRAAVRSDQCRSRRPTIRCSRSAAANGKSATSRTSPTCWSIPEGSLERRNHWEKTSHSLLVGAILHVLYAEADKTLAGVATFLSDPKRPIEATLRAMMTTPHLGTPGRIRSSPRRRASCSTSPTTSAPACSRPRCRFLGLYRDPVVARSRAAATGASPTSSADASSRPRSTSSCRRPTSPGPSR